MRARSAAPRQRGAPPGLASCAGALQILLSAVQALLWGRPSKDASRVRGVDPRVISSVRASTWPVLAKLALVFLGRMLGRPYCPCTLHYTLDVKS